MVANIITAFYMVLNNLLCIYLYIHRQEERDFRMCKSNLYQSSIILFIECLVKFLVLVITSRHVFVSSFPENDTPAVK